jgi:RNA 2',3'-cyclic 3'-phosphodiesterase
MRLFTAIEISAEMKENVRVLVDRLRATVQGDAKVSWTRTENLHITTKFIGEWPEGRLSEVKSALVSVKSPGAIAIDIRGIGWFPDARHPKVLFAGVRAGEGLAELARATDDAMAAIGVAKEDRKYMPHLTLARMKASAPLASLRIAIDSLESADLGTFRATAFYLYLSAAGKYSKLAEFSLN